MLNGSCKERRATVEKVRDPTFTGELHNAVIASFDFGLCQEEFQRIVTAIPRCIDVPILMCLTCGKDPSPIFLHEFFFSEFRTVLSDCVDKIIIVVANEILNLLTFCFGPWGRKGLSSSLSFPAKIVRLDTPIFSRSEATLKKGGVMTPTLPMRLVSVATILSAALRP